ncbi:adenosylhomocysteinase [Candidatus Microgenomates bacterium]|nr:adenosylhomocysteinase [Candidatus Microgenomates bacterium]
MNSVKSDIKDINLADFGQKKIDWAGHLMPVLNLIRRRFAKEKPLEGITIGACLHVTAETANLMLTLTSGGAKVALCASNPLSTKNEVASALVKNHEISTFAICGEDNKTYYSHLQSVLDFHPQITMDDGADLVSLLHQEKKDRLREVLGSSEETTTGVNRLKAMEKNGALKIPIVAVNESDTKHLFDNRYGTGQSSIDGIIRATNILLAGKTLVVAGYGWCGRGVAMRAKGMGANVIVTEVNPIAALEAVMDGFRVMKISQAAKIADIIITATGNKHVIDSNIIDKLKSGAIIANTGHFDVEIDVVYLEKAKKAKRTLRDNLEEYILKTGQKVYLLSSGRLVNLAAAEGHPPDVMDLSFANQALACEWIIKNKGKLKNKVYVLPKRIDQTIARLKLRATGISFDSLTKGQRQYLGSWQEGT